MARQTRNSLDSSFFLPTASTSGADLQSPSPSGTTTSVASGAPSSVQLSPEIIAAVAHAVRSAMAAEKASAPTGLVSPDPPSVAALTPSAIARPSQAAGLNARAVDLLSSGAGFSPLQATSAATGQQGRSPLVVPSFVSTFAPPVASLAPPSSIAAQLGAQGSSADFGLQANVPLIMGVATPTLEQPFVVGPGFSPIPSKLVAQIVSGKYVDLSDLLAVNLVQTASEPQLLFDGRVVLTSSKRQRRRLDDITSWVEAFSVFSLVLTSYFPNRWRDITQYKLLILRTYRQFGGRVWLAYDQAFREHAAATKLADWSTMNVQLYNFHSAGASVRSLPGGSSSDSAEPKGSSSSQVVCKSWNRGRCSSPYAFCRFAHICSSCSGSHRAHRCSSSDSRPKEEEHKRRSSSPDQALYGSSKHRKYRE